VKNGQSAHNNGLLLNTPLLQRHEEMGAKMVPFAGYNMPLFYEGIIKEHLAVRREVGLFDISHMGVITVKGRDATDFLDRMLTNNPRLIRAGQAQYSLLLNEGGGILDDLVVYRLDDGYLLVVNASRREHDFAWLSKNRFGDVVLNNDSRKSAIIAVQGPRSRDVLGNLGVADLDSLYFMEHRETAIEGRPVLLSCSGYTGEDGFEIIVAETGAVTIWDALVAAGENFGLKPAGLGARDTLRTEMCYHLYGQDMDENTNPVEAGLGWTCRNTTRRYLGWEAVARAKSEKPARFLVAFRTESSIPPRSGAKILVGEKQVGRVTSGTYSPSLGCGIGLGYVAAGFARIGNKLSIEHRGRTLPAVVAGKPLYNQGSIRRRPKAKQGDHHEHS